jgi:peptidase E
VIRQVFAFSGVLSPAPGERGSQVLVDHALSLARPGGAGHAGPVRLCYVPTAIGDDPAAVAAYQRVFGRRNDVDLTVLRLFPQPNVPDVRAHLLRQEVVLVEGGSVVNLMAVWRAHGLPDVLRECWEAGVVLTGSSAGSLVWHLGGPTDAWRDQLDPFTDGLGLLRYSNGVHDDLTDRPRRSVYRRLVADGTLPAGFATEEGVGLHYVGTRLSEVVTMRPGAQAWEVRSDGRGGCLERPLDARPI